MKTIHISKGGTTAIKIELHDPELNIVVHDAVEVKMPLRGTCKGWRVRNLQASDFIKYGATGTVEESDSIPLVKWDSEEMLTEVGKASPRWIKEKMLPRSSQYLELIEEVTEAHAHIAIDNATKGEYTGGKVDYSHLIGKWVRFCCKGHYLNGRWFKIARFDEFGDPAVYKVSNDEKICLFNWEVDELGYVPMLRGHLDLSNPLDYNPDEKPDYSNCIGKFVRCYANPRDMGFISVGKWCLVTGIDKDGFVLIEGGSVCPDYGWDKPEDTFDFSNPRDTNPDEPVEVKIPFDVNRVSDAIRYETRDGREVKCVVVNDVDSEYPVTGYISNATHASSWPLSGKMFVFESHHADLFMVVKEVKP